MKHATFKIYVAATLLLFLLAAVSARACPMCKDSTVDATQPNAQHPTGLEFNRSVYIMLGGFSGLAGMTGTVLYKACRSRA